MNGDQFLRKLLKPSATISEMFETLTVEGAWDYLNYYPLECIIEKFGNDSTRKKMERYKRDLTGYTLMTAIKDHPLLARLALAFTLSACCNTVSGCDLRLSC